MSDAARPLPRLKGYLPDHISHTFEAVGTCIYCGATRDLSDEHIIPLGLGGRFVLPQASCPTCSRITSEFERTCLRRMYGPLRLLYDLPSRRSTKRPETLNLKVKYAPDQDWTYVPVRLERYPFLVTFPYLGMPRMMTKGALADSPGPVTSRLWIRGASPEHDFKQLLQSLTEELGVCSLMPESHAEVTAFCKLLAKIAHAYAIAELGFESVKSVVAPFIVTETLDHCLHYIGSQDSDEPPTDQLHELEVAQRLSDSLLIVKIRLLAKLGTPTYYVVVGNGSHNAS